MYFVMIPFVLSPTVLKLISCFKSAGAQTTFKIIQGGERIRTLKNEAAKFFQQMNDAVFFFSTAVLNRLPC